MQSFGSPQQPITLAEVEQQVATYQQALDEAQHRVEVVEHDLQCARIQRDTLKLRVAAWRDFVKTLKDLH
jgi:hypothetical protein